MLVVHQALRDSLGSAPQLVRAVDAADTARRAMITNLYDNILAFLHVHHEGEEKLVFPLLRDRCPDQAGLLDHMEAQHADVVGLIDESGSAPVRLERRERPWHKSSPPPRWGSWPRDSSNISARRSVRCCPCVAENLSLEEWGALPGHAMGNFTGDKVWLILGLIRDRMSQAQRDQMLAHMPPPAVDMWTSMGEQAYKNLVAEVGPPLG